MCFSGSRWISSRSPAHATRRRIDCPESCDTAIRATSSIEPTPTTHRSPPSTSRYAATWIARLISPTRCALQWSTTRWVEVESLQRPTLWVWSTKTTTTPHRSSIQMEERAMSATRAGPVLRSRESIRDRAVGRVAHDVFPKRLSTSGAPLCHQAMRTSSDRSLNAFNHPGYSPGTDLPSDQARQTRVALVDELGGVQSSIQACPRFEGGYQHWRRVHVAAGGGEIFSGKHLQRCVVLHAWR